MRYPIKRLPISKIKKAGLEDSYLNEMMMHLDKHQSSVEVLTEINIRDISIVRDEYEARWLSLEHRDKYPSLSLYLDKLPSPVSLVELSYLLAAQLRKSIPKELQMQGLTMKTQGSKCHFCISGSFPLDNLEQLFESFQKLLLNQNEK